MLPDYPKTKELLSEMFHERVKTVQYQKLGLFSQINPTQLHEGIKCHLYRDDGSFEDIELKQIQASVSLEQNIQDLENMDVEKVADLLDNLGEQLAGEQVSLIIQELDKAVHETGNIANSDLPFLEQFFDSVQKIDLDFDVNGIPIMPQFLVGSDETRKKIEETLSQIESDPMLRVRFDNLIEKKRLEWRDREASRNLVG
ncbi:hypothetical protein [Gimesia sp.]|uniref:hypothetical protein n=1 Tax=Gimesia sp. TaxID=2024833 RepID=UPI0032EE0A15